MYFKRVTVGLLAVGMTVLGSEMVRGQEYPNKTIRIVTSGTGGSSDFMARLIAEGLKGPLGQPLIVDNRSQSHIPMEVVSEAPPDGYTLLVFGATLWLAPLMQKTPYDAMKDFLPIALLGRSPNLLVVHPSLPVSSVKELIAFAKTRPGELNHAAGSRGGSSHLSGELFKAMAGVNMVHVPYKNSSQETADLIGGHLQLAFGSASQLAPQMRAGKVRGLAVTSAQPSVLFPQLPTIAAAGLPGYEAVGMTGIWAPAGTPEAIVRRLNQEAVRFIKLPEGKERLLSTGVEAIGSSAEEFKVAIESDIARMDKVIKAIGLRLD